MEFKIEHEAHQDIQNEIKYYNEKQKGLGKKFHADILKYFNAIKKNPFYPIRYSNVRCLPLKKFPAMIHFTINEDQKQIIIRAVINTHKDPDQYWL